MEEEVCSNAENSGSKSGISSDGDNPSSTCSVNSCVKRRRSRASCSTAGFASLFSRSARRVISRITSVITLL